MKRLLTTSYVPWLMATLPMTMAWTTLISPSYKGGLALPSFQRTATTTSTTTALSSSSSQQEVPDYTGKTIYQRTLYRLSPGSSVALRNAIIVEERVRFQMDPERPDYVLPVGPRTFVFRAGIDQEDWTASTCLTKELYQCHVGTATHNGPGTVDNTIATILFLASNPQLIQGDVLQLASEDGVAGVFGCIGAKIVSSDAIFENANTNSDDDDLDDVMTLPSSKEEIFPPRMHQLTLSGEGEYELKDVYDMAKTFSKAGVILKDVRWRTRIPGRRYDRYYRLILGSDMDFSYPEAKELARTVANYLLPSNEFAVTSLVDNAAGGTGGNSRATSFGALGMDLSPPSAPTQVVDPEKEVDTTIPPAFVLVSPEIRETTTYLRQFLEKGFRMTVRTGYLKMEKLAFSFQTLPIGTSESELEKLDLVPKAQTSKSYQSFVAIHHPDYAGGGSGEYFFPLETGEYEGGSRSTYLEPETDGSPW